MSTLHYLCLVECTQTVLKMIVWWERKEGGRGIRGGGVDRRANSGAVVAVSELYQVTRRNQQEDYKRKSKAFEQTLLR